MTLLMLLLLHVEVLAGGINDDDEVMGGEAALEVLVGRRLG
jgi:hypothetical protein